ncbi:MAG: TolC family protein [Sedimentisphaerales bacterium]|nr:TolC family protein [Sedimentisphaerales bacterium]
MERRNRAIGRFSVIIGVLGVLLGAAGCQTRRASLSVDEQINSLLDEKQPRQEPWPVCLHPGEQPLAPPAERLRDYLTDHPAGLSLTALVDFALRFNPTLQEQQQIVYQQALALTGLRYQIIPSAPGHAPARIPADPNGLRRLSPAGPSDGQTTTQLAAVWARLLTGPLRGEPAAVLRDALADPLPANIQPELMMEERIQAERDLLYQIRLWYRLRRLCIFEVLDLYYRALELRNEQQITERHWQQLERVWRQMQQAAAVGRAQGYELDRLQQEILQIRNQKMQIEEELEGTLVELRCLSGIPMDYELSLDDQDVSMLLSADMVDGPATDWSAEALLETAYAHRLDLANAADAVEDAARQVIRTIYKPNAKLRYTRRPDGRELETCRTAWQYLQVHFARQFDRDMPFDLLMERNDFRRELFALDQRLQEYEQVRETIRLEVRRQWRWLESARQRIEIQNDGRRLAHNRVETIQQLLQNGRARINDLVAAQKDLWQADRDFSDAKTDAVLALLGLYRDLGVLGIRPDGTISTTLAAESSVDR